MALHKVCDRCGRQIDTLEGYLSMRRWGHPRFTGLIRRKNKEVWSDMPQELDLCEQCTKDFFMLIKVTKELS